RPEHIGNNFFTGEGCKGQRTNKLLRRARHHDLHTNAAVLQKAHDFRRLISCNPTGHAQRNFHSRKTAATASTSGPAYRIDAASGREIQTRVPRGGDGASPASTRNISTRLPR